MVPKLLQANSLPPLIRPNPDTCTDIKAAPLSSGPTFFFPFCWNNKEFIIRIIEISFLETEILFIREAELEKDRQYNKMKLELLLPGSFPQLLRNPPQLGLGNRELLETESKGIWGLNIFFHV